MSNNWGGKREGAGRPKGKMNNRTEELIDRISKKHSDWCPIEQLIEIARDKDASLELRAACCTRIAGHIYSKPKVNIDTNVKPNLAEMIIAARKRAGKHK